MPSFVRSPAQACQVHHTLDSDSFRVNEMSILHIWLCFESWLANCRLQPRLTRTCPIRTSELL